MNDEPAVEHTLGLHSVEGFLTDDELTTARTSVLGSGLLCPACDTRMLDISVHEVPRMTAREVATSYSPNGRAELRVAPAEVGNILDRAFARSLPMVRAVYPTALTISEWILVAYRPGQFIVSHVDLLDLRPSGQWKIAGLSVLIQAPDEGGEFFIETSAVNHSWRHAGPSWQDSPGEFDSDFRASRRSRWTCAPRAGDALLYGSRLAHGTLPVAAGLAIKALTFIY